MRSRKFSKQLILVGFCAILMTVAAPQMAYATAAGSTPSETCDPKIWDAMTKKGTEEAQREMEVAKDTIKRPTSTLELNCFAQGSNTLAERLGAMFSDTDTPTNRPMSVNNGAAVLEPLSIWIGDAFNGGTFSDAIGWLLNGFNGSFSWGGLLDAGAGLLGIGGPNIPDLEHCEYLNTAWETNQEEMNILPGELFTAEGTGGTNFSNMQNATRQAIVDANDPNTAATSAKLAQCSQAGSCDDACYSDPGDGRLYPSQPGCPIRLKQQ